MKLDGKSSLRDDKNILNGPVNLQKSVSPVFSDEWDFVLENYTIGANDPYIIDSIAALTVPQVSIPAGYEAAPLPSAIKQSTETVKTKRSVIAALPAKKEIKIQPALPLTTEQKFISRTKILQNVIPVTGDSIELRFYDNAEIDGDSIALYLNNKQVFQHLLLSDQPYSIKFSVNDLQADNELVMVAENLGSIPPNTSLMVVIVGDKRYEARLYADESSSALVRFVKSRH